MALNIVEKIDDAVQIQNVIVSVSDKSGLDVLVPGLVQLNPEITFYSTGGTYRALHGILGEEGAARHLVAVSDYTGQPEMQGGLVKTLDFKIYLGLLSETYNAAHRADLARTQSVAMDMVVVNLYPFRSTIESPDVTPEQARTNIDIGGPCMVRASAKNYLRVAPVIDPSDYAVLLNEMRTAGGCLSLRTRLGLAKKAFAHTAEYDTAIAAYLGGRDFDEIRDCYRM